MKTWMKLALAVLISAAMAFPLCTYFLNNWGILVGNRLNDFLIMILPRPPYSGKIEVVGVTRPGSLQVLEGQLRALTSKKPLLVIVSIPVPIKSASPAELKKFKAFLAKNPNIYFQTGSPHGEQVPAGPEVFIPLTQDRGAGGDGRVRRLIVSFDSETGTAIPTLLDILNKYGFNIKPEEFQTYLMGRSSQTHLRYRDPMVAPILPIEKLDASAEGKVLVLGHVDYNDEEDWGISISNEWMTLGQRVVLDAETLVNKDSIDRFMREGRQVFAFIFVFLYLVGVFFLSPIAATLWGFVVIVFYFFVALCSLYFFNRLMHLAEVPATLAFLHLFVAPALLIRHLRARDRQVAELEMQRLRSSLVIKSARAEQGLKIATQVAHDMRSPLTALMIANEYKGNVNPEAADLIDKSIVRLHRISDELLKKFRTGGLYDGAVAQVLNLSEILSEIKEAYEKSWTRLKIHIQCPPDVLVKTSDPTAIERAISNMLNNSLEAVAKNVSLEVRLKVKKAIDSMIEIEFADNGPGIPEEIRARIFERGETHNKVGGSGLGLWQVRETFRALKGDAVLQDKTPGAHFLLTLSSGLVPQVLRLRRNVILLEDNNSVRERWQKRLGELGANVIAYSSPEEFEKHKEDVLGTVVTDLIFENSDKTGFQVLESLQGKRVQKILCTSLGNNAEIHDMAGRLADVIFTKVQFEELLFTDTTHVEFSS